MRTKTYAVCDCGAELRSKADGLILCGKVYEIASGDPRTIHTDETVVHSVSDEGQAICRSCFHVAVGWPPVMATR